MEKIISNRIGEVTLDGALTQQEVATFLGKTPTSISDTERGKVQITASELHKLTGFFGKPIEYLYGEDLLEEDVQMIVALLRRIPPDLRESQTQVFAATLALQQEQDIIESLEITDIEEAMPTIERVYKNLIHWLLHVTDLRNKALIAKGQLEELLGIKEDKAPPED